MKKTCAALTFLVMIFLLVATAVAPISAERMLYRDAATIVAKTIVSKGSVDETSAIVLRTKRWSWLPISSHRFGWIPKEDPWLLTAKVTRYTIQGTVHLEDGSPSGLILRADDISVTP